MIALVPPSDWLAKISAWSSPKIPAICAEAGWLAVAAR